MAIDLGLVTAYAYAVAGGYEGTEAEFEQLLGDIANDLSEIENLSVVANTLPAGSSATASYSDGVLTLGIPKGDTGATGAGATVAAGTTTTGAEGTNASVTNSGTSKDAVFNFTIPRGNTGNGIDSIYLTGTSGAVKTYTILFTDGNTTTFEVTDGEVTEAQLESVLEDYARIDGYYEDLTAGYAENLISNVYDEENVPYNFRTAGGSLDIGTFEYDEIVGGSVAVNQLVNTGATSVTVQSGHKYFSNINNVKTIGASTGTAISINDASKDNVIDLTLLFGSTIADYIYTLEQGQAGAGVAWFKKLFPKSYYPYNTGELMHVQTSGHKMVGFNAYNPTTETAELVGGMEYEISGTYTSVSYTDINGEAETITISGGKFTPTNNGTLTVTGGNATDTCVHLVWDGERDGEYEAYTAHTYPLDSDLVLRGIPKLDSANKLYYDGDTYEADGTVTRKYGVVDLGTLNWASYGTGLFYANLTGAKPSEYAIPANALCSAYAIISMAQTATKMGIAINNGQSRANAHDTSYADATAFKTAMSGVYLVYELATPTTETADTFQSPQSVSNWGTEEYIDTRSIPIPVGHNTKYPPDLKAKLETSPNPPDADGDYIVRQTNGVNEYVALSTNATIQNIISRLEALEG